MTNSFQKPGGNFIISKNERIFAKGYTTNCH